MNYVKYVYLLLATLLLLQMTYADNDDHATEENADTPEDDDASESEALTPEQKKENERLSKLEGHLKPLGSVGPYFDIYTIDGFPKTREFFNKYVIASTPLLLKNAAKISPAFTKWTDEYFLNHPGSAKEQIFAEGRKKEIRTEPGSMMSFKQFVEQYNTTDMYMVHGLPSHLRTDVVVPPPLQCEPVMKGILDVVTWFSSGGTKSVLHNDDVDNINCLYRGTKTLIFINPHDDDDMWARVIDNLQGSYSSLDVDAVDFIKFPDLAKVRYARVDMVPGDCLFIPYRWYHQVNSFGSNLAVNVWWTHDAEGYMDLNDEICGEASDTVTIADLSFPGMEGENVEGGAYGQQPDPNQPTTEEFLKRFNTEEQAEGQEGEPTETDGGGLSYSDDYEAPHLHDKDEEDVDPTVDETDPEEDPYIEPEEDSLTDKIYQAVLRVRKPIHMSGLKKYIIKKIVPPGRKMSWDDRCQDILVNYFGMLDQNKDTVITVEDADLFYANDEHALSQFADVTAFFQEDLHQALILASVKKERELVQKLVDRGELDKEQVSKIFGDKLIMPGVSDQVKDEL